MADPAQQHQSLQQQTGPAITGPGPACTAEAKPGNTTSIDNAVKHAASVTISPATSNRNLKFDEAFGDVFMPCSLRRAFKDHAAFQAVFEEGPVGFGGGWGGGGSLGPKSIPAKIVALSEDLAVAEGAEEKNAATTITAAPADNGFVLTSAPKGLVTAIMTAYNRYFVCLRISTPVILSKRQKKSIPTYLVTHPSE